MKVLIYAECDPVTKEEESDFRGQATLLHDSTQYGEYFRFKDRAFGKVFKSLEMHVDHIDNEDSGEEEPIVALVFYGRNSAGAFEERDLGLYNYHDGQYEWHIPTTEAGDTDEYGDSVDSDSKEMPEKAAADMWGFLESYEALHFYASWIEIADAYKSAGGTGDFLEENACCDLTGAGMNAVHFTTPEVRKLQAEEKKKYRAYFDSEAEADANDWF